MNLEDIRAWLTIVHGGLEGWINLRAIDPDQKAPPLTRMVRTIEEATQLCQRNDGRGLNIYAGLCRRGEAKNAKGQIEAGESNLGALQVLWADLDSGTREEQLRHVAEFPIRPTLTVDSGGGLHAIWQLDDPIVCASDPASNQRVRRILRGIQAVMQSDPAVCEPARIYRVAGTTNYPNARKRALGRGVTHSTILERSPYTVTLDDFGDFELRGTAEMGAPQPLHDHGEALPASIEVIFRRLPKVRALYYCEQREAKRGPSEEDLALATWCLRYAPWTSDADMIAALRYRRIALAHLVKGSHKSTSYYATTVRKARAEAERCGWAEPDFERSAARWFQWALTRALTPQDKPEEVAHGDHSRELSRVRTGDPLLDANLRGGVYGFTALAGDSGVGKSTLALNIACNAARDGWDVLYVAAEMEQADYEDRMQRYYDVDLDGLRAMVGLPRFYHVADGLEWDALTDCLLAAATDRTQRILIVIDSLTKVSAFLDREQANFSLHRMMGLVVRFCEGAVRYGVKRVATLVTSELNKDREALGRRITYSASLQINIMREKKDPSLVNLSIPKARFGPAVPEWGPYRQLWRSHRLDKIGALTLPTPEYVPGAPEVEEPDQGDLQW